MEVMALETFIFQNISTWENSGPWCALELELPTIFYILSILLNVYEENLWDGSKCEGWIASCGLAQNIWYINNKN